MITPAFFVKNKVQLIGLGVIIIAALAGYLYVTNLQNRVATLTTENITLKTQLKNQNDAIATFKTDADRRLAAAQEQLKIAQQQAEQAKTRSRIIYRTVPSKGTATCEADRQSTLDLFNSVRR